MNKLAQRLNHLREQGGQVDSSTQMIQSQLKQLYHQQPSTPEKSCDIAALCQQLNACQHSENLLIKETLVSMASKHGFQQLDSETPLNALLKIDKVHQQSLSVCDSEDIVYMDTETSGLAGGTGTLVFQMGVGRIKNNRLTVRQYLMLGYQAEVEMLNDIKSFTENSKILVTFNGKSFDQPLLSTRCKLNHIEDLFADHIHIDLLYPLRRAFSTRWSNCQLQTAEKNILNFHREHDLPGSQVPDVWFNWLRFSTTDKFNALLEHNYFDILSLLALSLSLSRIYTFPDHYNADISSIAAYLDRQGLSTQAFSLLKKHRNYLDEKGLLLLASIARRKKEWSIATNVWNRLRRNQNPEALERLAKYYEHVADIPSEALELTRLLRSQQPENPDHRRRERRLLVKVQCELAL